MLVRFCAPNGDVLKEGVFPGSHAEAFTAAMRMWQLPGTREGGFHWEVIEP